MRKFLTFNIRNSQASDGSNGWINRRESVVSLLRDQNADVVGLQEVMSDQLEYLAAALGEYNWVGVAREDGKSSGEYAPIFYHRDLWLGSSETFWLSETPSVPGSRSWGSVCTRICTAAHFQSFSVFNCHLDHVSQEARANGLRLIATRANERSSVIMGDMNAEEGNPALGKLALWTDTYRAVHPEQGQVCTFNSFDPGKLDGDKIDYIFAPRHLNVLDADIVRTPLAAPPVSDHFAVFATLDLN